MIDHEHRCIFIHIPRTGGTSIEAWLNNGTLVYPGPHPEKHLLACQARELYADWWASYFKFSIVRNPWTRMLSCLQYPRYFGVGVRDGRLTLDGYYERFERDGIVLEHDAFFYRRWHLRSPRHRPMCVYGNILDEELDAVYRLEDLSVTIAALSKRLGIVSPFIQHHESARPEIARLRDEVRGGMCDVQQLFRRDFEVYGYEQ